MIPGKRFSRDSMAATHDEQVIPLILKLDVVILRWVSEKKCGEMDVRCSCADGGADRD